MYSVSNLTGAVLSLEVLQVPLYPVETVISVLKRKYGAAVSSRMWPETFMCDRFREKMLHQTFRNVERAVKLGPTLLDRFLARLLYFNC
jgi:hypothetical protein